MKIFFMADLSINSDAFSHGQIKSKLWLLNHFDKLLEPNTNNHKKPILHWYGSWVGLGPFLLLSKYPTIFKEVNLYDLDHQNLEKSNSVLNFWLCEGLKITSHKADVNKIKITDLDSEHIIVNTSCEHMIDDNWLLNIPSKSKILMQSTNMPHEEHVNKTESVEYFYLKYYKHIELIFKDELHFNYPNMTFSRHMILGIKI